MYIALIFADQFFDDYKLNNEHKARKLVIELQNFKYLEQDFHYRNISTTTCEKLQKSQNILYRRNIS